MEGLHHIYPRSSYSGDSVSDLSVSIYEDFLKKIIFEMPFDWQDDDYIAFLFVFVFFLGLLMMPSILDGEKNEFKTLISSWFNKDARKLRKLELTLSNFDKKTVNLSEKIR